MIRKKNAFIVESKSEEREKAGRRCGEGGRSAVLSNVSCQFSLCLQTETAPRKQGGCNRIKTVLQRERRREGRVRRREKGKKMDKGEGPTREHGESGGNNWLCGQLLILH